MSRVLFIGLDSADPRLLQQWCDDGVLPRLRAFRDGSAIGRVSPAPTMGHDSMWVSVATGVSPAQHQIYYYRRQFDPASYRSAAFDPADVKEPAIWQQIGEQGYRSVVIDFPLAPLSTGLNGVQICDWGAHDPLSPSVRTWPPALAESITASFGRNPAPVEDVPGRSHAEFHQFQNQIIERVERKTAMIGHQLAEAPWDLFLAVYAEPHSIAHQCWHLHDRHHPRYDAAYVERYGDPVRAVYRALDLAVGRILDCVDPATTVFLFCATGMGPNYTGNHLLDEALRRIEHGPAMPRISLLKGLQGTYRKALSKRLRVSLTPLADIVEDRLLAKERRRRRFFMVPHSDIGGAVRINLKGREAQGLVDPGEAYERCCETVIRELAALVNADTGEAAIVRVLRSGDIYEGEHLDALPDLFVQWSRAAPITGLRSPRIGEVRGIHQSDRSGDHYADGLVWARSNDGSLGQRFAQPIHPQDMASLLAGALAVA
jgi:predicted AlkP superfamily phosphohydrolase/phosphomutase